MLLMTVLSFIYKLLHLYCQYRNHYNKINSKKVSIMWTVV